MTDKKIAIACQGGGSHTAFTAGALKYILRQKMDEVDITAISGTSGGAICAFLTWYGLLKKDPDLSIHLLETFWKENSSDTVLEQLLNNQTILIQNLLPGLDFNPYFFPEFGLHFLQNILETIVRWEDIPGLITKQSPKLLIGAVDVCSGEFTVFRENEISVDVLLASAAVPTLFRAVTIEGKAYWDGMLSQNPPVRDLAREKPNELWVIQINPPERNDEPRSSDDIRDRRNELAGNLSLHQELYFIAKINEFVSQGIINDTAYIEIEVRKIIMEKDLPYSSKLDRNPKFLKEMMDYGEQQAKIAL